MLILGIRLVFPNEIKNPIVFFDKTKEFCNAVKEIEIVNLGENKKGRFIDIIISAERETINQFVQAIRVR